MRYKATSINEKCENVMGNNRKCLGAAFHHALQGLEKLHEQSKAGLCAITYI